MWRTAAEQALSPGCIPAAADAMGVQQRLRDQAAALQAIKSGEHIKILNLPCQVSLEQCIMGWAHPEGSSL